MPISMIDFVPPQTIEIRSSLDPLILIFSHSFRDLVPFECRSELLFCFISFSRFLGVCKADTGANTYYGRLIGSLESQYHGIRGDVYAVDARTLFIKGFSYDGKGQGKSCFFVFDFDFENAMTRSSRGQSE